MDWASLSYVFVHFHRGNSKYHYYGIRVKPGSDLTNVSDDGSPVAARSQGTKRTKAPQRSENSVNSDNSNPPPTQVSDFQVACGRVDFKV